MGLLYGENCTTLTSTFLTTPPVWLWRTDGRTDRRTGDSISCAKHFALAR